MRTTGLSFSAPYEVRWIDIELPPLMDGHVAVRTLYSGISPGSELLAYRGQIDPNLPLDETIGSLGGTFTYPFRYGYSCVGEVTGGDGLAPGTQVFAFSPHQEALVAPADDLVVLDGLPPRNATLFPLVETGLQIALEVAEVGGGPVAIVGLGPVGLLAGALLARSGIRVLGADPLPFKRAAARGLGFEAFAPSELSEVAPDEGVPVAIESSGREAGLRAALDLLAHEGTVLVASWFGAQPVELPLGGRFHRRRLTIRSTQVSTIPKALAGDWSIDRRRREAARLMTELPLDLLATHSWPHRAAAEAYAALDQGREGLIHAALAYE